MAFVKQYTDRYGTFNLVKAAKGPTGQDATTSTASPSAAAPSKSGDPTSAKPALLATNTTPPPCTVPGASPAIACQCVQCSVQQLFDCSHEHVDYNVDIILASAFKVFGTLTHDNRAAHRIAIARQMPASARPGTAVAHSYFTAYVYIEFTHEETVGAFISRFIDHLQLYHHHCDINDHARPSCGDVFKHFKARVRWTRGNQFSEIFQSHCNMPCNNILELADVFSDMSNCYEARTQAPEARTYLSKFVPSRQEHCTCCSCVYYRDGNF